MVMKLPSLNMFFLYNFYYHIIAHSQLVMNENKYHEENNNTPISPISRIVAGLFKACDTEKRL